MNLLDAICSRRTYYAISKETTINNDKITGLVAEALKHTPSAFNMQSARVIVLFDKHHDRLWDSVLTILKKVVPEKQVSATADKINGFKAGYGTILFFEDESVRGEMMAKYPMYQDRLLAWAEQGNAMLQSNIWMLLEEYGLGASLQHYNPLIDEVVQKTWNTPKHWRLIAQMPFGVPVEPPAEKTFLSVKERLKVYGD